MQGIRKAVTFLVLTTTLSVTAPSLGMSGEVCKGEEEVANVAKVHPAARLNLAQLRSMPGWSPESMASSQSPAQEEAQKQPTDKKSWSTAKKTWVIVGSVVGAALVVAAVSNSGGGGGGGGY
jgi:hypothetical protein